eukprot:TRINITY_DN4581_c0_g1::TRINITY_DN4581_c0_g1_i1::g.23276::m.23276 TRINITY_DN4581_c0_g1::TRINITY_DN4581_c0_g1_i1::g.23276  ORF type:complete len:137 (+),score=30.67,PsbW/PF07123.7/6 TRINITY_DN4581_c0_g1_i1:63-413(+)
MSRKNNGALSKKRHQKELEMEKVKENMKARKGIQKKSKVNHEALVEALIEHTAKAAAAAVAAAAPVEAVPAPAAVADNKMEDTTKLTKQQRRKMRQEARNHILSKRKGDVNMDQSD